jgi:phosphopantothenoylcysteine decarboxylase/phosphopantothenate--cysteine ligase
MVYCNYSLPKILSFIKKWNPNCFLISFKFENNITNDELINIAYNSLNSNNCDLVIANDKAEMKKSEKHISYFINKNKEVKKIEEKENIAKEIIEYIRQKFFY